MRKELPYFNVENDFGGDQHKLDRFIMIKGGCAAVTACDCSIYWRRATKAPCYNFIGGD